MKKVKNTLLTILCLALVAVLSVAGTLAYLQDDDSDVNVMTLGNVEIEQLEYERVVDENGDPVKGVLGEDFTTNYGITESYKLQEFTQAKPAYPAVYANGDTAWDEFQQLWNQVGAPGSNDLFDDSMKNVVDKFVFVKNTGRSDAYYRTIIAIEAPEGTKSLIHTSFNSNNRFDAITQDDKFDGTADSGKKSYLVGYTTINGVRYALYNMTYNQVLVPGEVSRPSLLQVYLDPKATNDDCAKFGETWDILVLSQAVQTKGFENAGQALDAAFGEVTEEKVQEWFKSETVPTVISNEEELKDVLSKGGNYVLANSIVASGESSLEIAADVNMNLNLNGYTITNKVSGAPALINNGTLTISGEGSIVNGTNDTKASHTIVNNGTLVIESGNIGTDDTAGAAVVNYGTTTINGGTFASKQENVKADGLCAYAFINQAGTMTINNATLNGQTHGLFGAYGGEIIVNDGTYTLDGNGGLGCYLVYATGDAVVTLNGGTYNTDEPRSNRVFFVYDNGNYFNAAAVATGKVVVNDGASIYLNGVEQNY